MTKTYQLWHGDGTRSIRVLWLLEELGLRDQVDVHPVLFPARVRQPDYLDVNPRGSLPYLIDGDVKMTESIAILQFLAERHAPTALAVRGDEPGFADYLEFTMFGEAALMPPIGLMVRARITEPDSPRAPEMLEEARRTLDERQGMLVRALRQAPFLAASRFTLADISVGYSLELASLLGERAVFAPEVAAYADRLAARPARIRAYAPTG